MGRGGGRGGQKGETHTAAGEACHGHSPKSSGRTTVLHLFGSEVSEFYWKVSATYVQKCVESTIKASTAAGFDFVYAQVHPGGRWSFPRSVIDVPRDELKDDIETVDGVEGVRVLSAMGCDIAMTHLFDYPGMTTYRSLLDLLGVPFVGCPAEVMALSTNKQQTKAIVAAAGVPVPRGVLLRRGVNETVDLPLPLIVKPCSEDNSQGISLVRDAAELRGAIDEAFRFDDEVLVEEFVPLGYEVRVGVLEDEHGEPTVVLPPIEYHLTEKEPIRSQRQKFNVDPKTGQPTTFFKCKVSTPSVNVPKHPGLMEKMARAARTAHKALGCRDYSLYDFRVSPSGEPYMLEAGLYCSFAPTSIIVRMAGCNADTDPSMAHVPLFHSFLRRALARKRQLEAFDPSTAQTHGMKARRGGSPPTNGSGSNHLKLIAPQIKKAPRVEIVPPAPDAAPDAARRGWQAACEAAEERKARALRHWEAKKAVDEGAGIDVPQPAPVASRSFAGCAWGSVTAALFAAVLLLSSVVSVALVASALVLRRVLSCVGAARAAKKEVLPPSERLTVLVSGAKMTKALYAARALGRRGHRVVMCETAGYSCVGSRWSRYVSAFYITPDPRKDMAAYKKKLAEICELERVDVFVPVAAPSVAVLEVRVAAELRAGLGLRVFAYEPTECAVLDDTAEFCRIAAGCGLGVPDTIRVDHADHAVALNERLRAATAEAAASGAPPPRRWLLKPNYYDPVRRSDLFTMPCEPRALATYLANVGVSPERPWCAQEFCVGRELNVGAVFVKGRVAAAAVTRSCASLLNLAPVKCEPIMDWMRRFGAATGVTGQAQVDFFLDDATRTVKAIEYNPRMGSTLLLVDESAAVADSLALRQALGLDGGSTKAPTVDAPKLYWLLHEVCALARALPTLSAPRALAHFLRVVATGKDAVLDLDDPLPFITCNHVQAPALMLWAAGTGCAWTKYEFCIGKVVCSGGD